MKPRQGSHGVFSTVPLSVSVDRSSCTDGLAAKAEYWNLRQSIAMSKRTFGPSDRKHKLWQTWENIMSKCYNRYNKAFYKYGARGIDVCDRWMTFGNFAADMGPSHFPGACIDLIDETLPFGPDNCQWITMSQQKSKQRQSHRGFNG